MTLNLTSVVAKGILFIFREAPRPPINSSALGAASFYFYKILEYKMVPT